MRESCGDTPPDSDKDGIVDADDACPGTNAGVDVDDRGCALDSDGDGIVDADDMCPGSEAGVDVDDRGCALDSDGDSIVDADDACPGTAPGVEVDDRGCALDSDNDGVVDNRDQCPGTATGVDVNKAGCEPVRELTIDIRGDEFASNSAELTPEMEAALRNAARRLRATAVEEGLVIVGHTDSMGAAAYNQDLSLRRARSVADFLAEQGIERSSMTVEGRGESEPIATNETAAGRARNRRVVIETR